MELGIHEGKVHWLKKDGTPANKAVAELTMLQYLGFSIPEQKGGSCNRMTVLLGDPYKDEKVVVKANADRWYGYFLLGRETPALKLDDEVELLMEEGRLKLKDAHKHYYRTRQQIKFDEFEEVSAESLANKKGLAVLEDYLGDQGKHIYWVEDEEKYVFEFPPGWIFLAKGDGGLTHALTRRHPHWIISHINSYRHLERTGIAVSVGAVEEEFERLGGMEGENERDRTKREAAMKRFMKHFHEFKKAVRRNYPDMPDEDVSELCMTATDPGRVGNAQFLHFCCIETRDSEYDEAATLAAIAHARHQYTNYDRIFNDFLDKKDARRHVWPEISSKLVEWSRSLTDKSDDED